MLDVLLAKFGFITVFHGGARGADALVEQWAIERRVSCRASPANRDKYGRAAVPIRNRQMLDRGVDLVVAFPGGRGTADMVRQARARGMPVREV